MAYLLAPWGELGASATPRVRRLFTASYPTFGYTSLERDADAFAPRFDALALSTRDPENLYYSSLMAAYVGDTERTLTTLKRAVEGGWLCHATIEGEPWLARVRDTSRFRALVAEAKASHERAAAAFREAGGHQLLGLEPR